MFGKTPCKACASADCNGVDTKSGKYACDAVPTLLKIEKIVSQNDTSNLQMHLPITECSLSTHVFGDAADTASCFEDNL